MAKAPIYTRPPFSLALNAWKQLLNERRHPTEIVWIFDENLCFEKSATEKSGFKLGFQTRFTPPPPDAERLAFDHFCDFENTVVFYRIGNSRGRSVCLLLSDEWFDSKGAPEGYVGRDEWRISFYTGDGVELEEITDEERWKQRILRDRPLHDLDFCMTLRAVHETLAHGRVLSAYEHYALRFLHAWKRLVRPD